MTKIDMWTLLRPYWLEHMLQKLFTENIVHFKSLKW